MYRSVPGKCHSGVSAHVLHFKGSMQQLLCKFIYLPCVHAQGVKQSVCPSIVVVVGTKIARSRVLGVCACCKHNQLVDIGEKLVCTLFELPKKAYQCYKSCIFCSACLWFIDHTHPFSIIATAHAQAWCWKGLSRHETAMPQSVAILRYGGYRARRVCALAMALTMHLRLLTIALVNQVVDCRQLLDIDDIRLVLKSSNFWKERMVPFIQRLQFLSKILGVTVIKDDTAVTVTVMNVEPTVSQCHFLSTMTCTVWGCLLVSIDPICQ